MAKKKNWAEEFERKKDKIEELASNVAKKKQLDKYNNLIRKLKEEYSNQNGRDYKAQIAILKEILETYCEIAKLEIEGIDVKKEIKKLEENINYLKFKQQYIEEYQIEEVDIKIARAKSEADEISDEERLEKYRKENSIDRNTLKMKEEADRSKESQSWEEYRKEEEKER